MKRIPALLLALIFLLCAGCGGSSADGAASAGGWSSSDSSAPQGVPAEAPDGGWGGIVEVSADAPASAEDGAGAPQKSVDLSDKIIYSAEFTIETLEFDASVSALDRLASQLGGFVESSQVSGHTRRQSDGTARVVDRYAYYTVRVPASRFQEALSQAGSLGSVTNSSSNAENITPRFTDQEARKHSLEVQEERLLAMLEKAEDVETLVALEERLSEVRYEIEAIERTLRNWQNQVDYSTVSVSLQEVAVYTPTAPVQRTFGERLTDAFADGWSVFVDGVQSLALFLASSLPVLILLAAAVVILTVLIRRVQRKRRGACHAASPKTGETDEPRPR